LELQKAEKIEPSVSAVFTAFQQEMSTKERLSLAKEFVSLKTKNSLIRLLQSVIKSLIIDKHQKGRFSINEYRQVALDVLAFVKYMERNKQNAQELAPILLAAGANLYKYVPEAALEVFGAIWSWVGDESKNVHILIFRSVSLCSIESSEWIEEFIKLHPAGVMSKSVGYLIRKMNRITNAVVDSINSRDGVLILKLSREERRFVEQVVSRTKVQQ
jgi:hypothetical protein